MSLEAVALPPLCNVMAETTELALPVETANWKIA